MSIRKTALEALKTKFEGIDEKVLSRIAAKIAKTAETDDEAKDEVEGLTLQGIIDSYVDSRVAEGSSTAVANYEKKHGLKDGKKVGAADDDDDEGDDDDDEGDGDEGEGNNTKKSKKTQQAKEDGEMPAWAKKLMDDLAELKQGKQQDKRKAALDKVLKDLPEEKRKSYNREYSRANFSDEDDFNAWLEEITTEVDEITGDANASASTSGQPKGGGGANTPQVDSYVKARAEARKAETDAPAIKGLPSSN